MFKSHLIKSDNIVRRKNLVDTYRAPDFAPDYSDSAMGLSAKM
jgi:hypothetical protein